MTVLNVVSHWTTSEQLLKGGVGGKSSSTCWFNSILQSVGGDDRLGAFVSEVLNTFLELSGVSPNLRVSEGGVPVSTSTSACA